MIISEWITNKQKEIRAGLEKQQIMKLLRCPTGYTGRKEAVKMNWLELNNGNLVNLEKVRCIIVQGQRVTYWFSENDSRVEIFNSSRDAQYWTEELRIKLLK